MFKRTRRLIGVTLGVATLAALMSAPAAAEQFAVIAQSPAYLGGSDAKAVVKQLFLRKRSTWPDGTEAKPYGPAQGGPERAAFIASVLGMSEAEVASHWIALKQKTGETAPRALGSASMIQKLVARKAGAFGVVPASEVAGMEGVVVLLTFPQGG